MMQKAFVDELEIVLEDKSTSDEKKYTNKNEVELLRKDFQILRGSESWPGRNKKWN